MKTLSRLLFAGLLVLLCIESIPLISASPPLESLPTCEQILTHYIDALGGREALLQVNDRLYTGTLTWQFTDRDPSELVIPARVFSSRPNKWRLFLETSKGPQGMGYDGTEGWAQNSDRIYADQNQKTSNLAFLFGAHAPLRLADYFPDLTRISKEQIGQRCVYRVEPQAPENSGNYLIFDAQTGLLLQIGANCKIGDYREMQGVTLPFRIEITRRNNKAIYTFDKIQHNVAFPPEKISRPTTDQIFPDAFEGMTESSVLPLLINFPSGHEDMNVPCRDGRFLHDLIIQHDYKRGLEIGTFTGYSALWIGLAFQRTGGKLIALEIDKKPGEEAQRNVQRAGLDAAVDVRIADAFDEIPTIQGSFDFVFIDAWKPDYMQFLEMLLDRVAPGGVIVAHNVTNYARDMQDFLKTIREDPGLETTLNEISAEGMSVSYVRNSDSVMDSESVSSLLLYPELLDEMPQLHSPFRDADGKEFVIAFTKEKKCTLVPVSIENGEPYVYARHGKGKQLAVDEADFPTLAFTGLHSDKELENTQAITGRSIAEITALGRPESSSGVGFMAKDEDIISVLKGDNRMVRSLGLTHPELARPMYHMWNLVLEQATAYWKELRPWADVEYFLYHGKKVFFAEINATKGWQESIFADEIYGGYHIRIHRELDAAEKAFLEAKYGYLNSDQFQELIQILSHIHTGEMEPYYIMRYGFYEGHTDYRVDPIAIAFIFGLKSLAEIEAAFPGKLYEVLTSHFAR